MKRNNQIEKAQKNSFELSVLLKNNKNSHELPPPNSWSWANFRSSFHLNLSYSIKVRNESMSEFSALKNLRELDLRYCVIVLQHRAQHRAQEWVREETSSNQKKKLFLKNKSVFIHLSFLWTKTRNWSWFFLAIQK